MFSAENCSLSIIITDDFRISDRNYPWLTAKRAQNILLRRFKIIHASKQEIAQEGKSSLKYSAKVIFLWFPILPCFRKQQTKEIGNMDLWREKSCFRSWIAFNNEMIGLLGSQGYQWMLPILAFVNFSTLSYPRVEVDHVCTR